MRLIISFTVFICILVFTNCTKVPSDQDRGNPFDSTGTNWNPPTVQASPAQQIVAVGDTAVVTASGVDNGSIARYFWSVDGVSQLTITDTLRLPVASQGTRIVRVYVKDNDGVRSKADSVLVLGKDKTPLLTAPINKTQLINNSMTLTWVAGFYSSHYKVLLDTVTPPVNVAVATTAGTSFTPAKGLVFSKNYYWQVIGYNSSGEEAASQVWGFKTGDKPAIPVDGLVAYWPFNGNAKDESGNGNDGTVNGPTLTVDRFGVSGKAYSFDGVNDFVRVSDAVSLDVDSALTISLWLVSTVNQPMTVISKWSDFDGNNRSYILGISADTLDFSFSTALTQLQVPFCQSKFSFPLQQRTHWAHVVISYDGTQKKFYLNGSLMGYDPRSGLIYKGIADLTIGAHLKNDSDLEYFFKGSIDDIRIYNRALTASEINDLFLEGGYVPPLATPALSAYGKDSTAITVNWSKIDGATTYVLEKSATATGSFSQIYSGSDTAFAHTGLTKDQKVYYRVQAKSSAKLSDWSDTVSAVASLIPTDGLVAYWPFNGNAKDESGNGNDGVVNGATLTLDRFGVSGKAYEFDGVNNFVLVNKDFISSLITSKLTFNYWLNIPHGATATSIPMRSTGTGELCFEYSLDTLSFLLHEKSGWISVKKAYKDFHGDAHMITGIYQYGISIELYLDGQKIGSTPIGSVFYQYTSNTEPFDIGKYYSWGDGSSNRFFKGQIDDIRIYNRAITEQEIQSLYHEGGWTGQ